MLRDVVVKFWLSEEVWEFCCPASLVPCCAWSLHSASGRMEHLKFLVGETVLSVHPVSIPVELAQWILPLGVFSWEPLHDSAGKLQRCLNPCCSSLSLQTQRAFLLSVSCLRFRHSNDACDTNLCWALRFEVEHTLCKPCVSYIPR